MKCLIIDNYDSFTYNLYQYVGMVLESRKKPFELVVKRNNEVGLEEIKKRCFDRIIISPGPGDPSDKAYFGVCSEVLLKISPDVSTLGICLGMQGMIHHYGGKVVRAAVPMHGKTSQVFHDSLGAYQGLPQLIQVMRYHSLVVDPKTIPEEFLVTSATKEGEISQVLDFKDQPSILDYIEKTGSEIMGVRHRKYPLEGIQFHPESFATLGGMKIVKNFLVNKNGQV